MEKARKTALNTAGCYLAVGMLWFYFSDRLLLLFIRDVEQLTRFQTGKGWFYVATTAGLLFLLRLGLGRRVQRLQDQLTHGRKMEALGRMAAGIVHDFNNTLGVILGNAEIARAHLAPEHPAADSVREIGLAGAKGKALVDRLLAFARGSAVLRRPIALGDLITEMEPLLRKMLPPATRFKVRDRSHGVCILADPDQVEQALLNLVSNAADAARPGLPGASVTIDVKIEGGKLLLTVADNGQGMSREVRDKVFEPFFSTKIPGKGTGLGLSTVYGTVHDSRGSIEVDSAPGRGATFKMRFLTCPSASSTKNPS